MMRKRKTRLPHNAGTGHTHSSLREGGVGDHTYFTASSSSSVRGFSPFSRRSR